MFHSVTEDLRNLVLTLEKRVASLEGKTGAPAPEAAKPAAAPAKAVEDEDDVDLFGSDSEEEDAEAAKVKYIPFWSFRTKNEVLLLVSLSLDNQQCFTTLFLLGLVSLALLVVIKLLGEDK